GYSTDGYSPKSVYPALSFESSGKSTPKSSYTISSLVSSELHLSTSSKGNTASLSSASCSVNNGLESDDVECASPRVLLKTSASLPPHPEADRSNLGLGNGIIINEKKTSAAGGGGGHENQITSQQHSHSIKQQPSNNAAPVTLTTRDSFRGNDNVSDTQCNPKKSSLSHLVGGEFTSHQQQLSPAERGGSMVAAKQMHGNCTSQGIIIDQNCRTGSSNLNSDNYDGHICSSTNPFCSGCSHRIQSSPAPPTTTPFDNNPHNHTRNSNVNELKLSVPRSASPDNSEGNSSSSLLTGSSNRNIRTSFVLVTTATSQIPECASSFSLKNSFSICSPRKERTRIKTNPWITFTNTTNDGNSNKVESNSSPVVIRVNKGAGHVGLVSGNTGTEKVSMIQSQHLVCRSSSTCLSSSATRSGIGSGGTEDARNETDNQAKGSRETGGEIRNMCNKGESRDSGIEDHHHHHHQSGDTLSLVYRISTSASASDSGLDLESGTCNRNSTESSLLSDSASTRNSMISHEAELGCSRSSSITSPTTFFAAPQQQQQHIGDYQAASSHHQCVKVPPVKVSSGCGGRTAMMGSSAGVSALRSTPTAVKKSPVPKVYNNNNNNMVMVSNNENSQVEDQDVTSSSITLPPELLSSSRSISVSAQTNVIMVDKQTDILSDWNTDDDGEDEIETDRNDDDDCDDEEEDERVTPTPSSPDTDTGGRAIFHRSQSTSSVTDIDFGDSSAATAASSTGIAPSSSIFKSQAGSKVGSSMYNHKGAINKISCVADIYNHDNHHRHNNMISPQTTCYSSNPTPPQQGGPQNIHWVETDEMYDRKLTMEKTTRITSMENDILRITPKTGVMYPTRHALGIDADSLCSDVCEFPDYNANKPLPNSSSSSNAIARGALGFLRKIFKKGSCSSHRTSPGSDKVKIPRSAKSKDSHLDDNIATITGLRSTSLITTADALVSPHPLVSRKPSINGYFLTPTPNAFRRRSGGGGGDSSDSNKGSHKHHNKAVKTDVIRLLPAGALSPTQQVLHANSSSSTSSSTKNATIIGAFSNNITESGNNNIHAYSNTSTNSTASSIHSMSTSTSAASNTGTGLGGENHVNGHPPYGRNQNQRLNDNFYSNSNSSRQPPFLPIENGRGHYPPPTEMHSTKPPQLPAQPPVPQDPAYHPYYGQVPTHLPAPTCQISHQQQDRDFGAGHVYRPPSTCGPYESPRLQNPHHHRINSPSFNNYSPIHRLVVTNGASQLLLNRGGSSTSTNNGPNCASPIIPPFQSTESPHLTSRNRNRGGADSKSYLHQHNNSNNNNTSSAAQIPNINRSYQTTSSSPSPLINKPSHQHHHHQQQPQQEPLSISSPRPQLPASNTFTSPSPIQRNPRYQYITSSNQNSPILNVPKRMNGGVTAPPPPSIPQNPHYYYHNHANQQNQEGGSSFPNGRPPPSFSTFSPTPPSRQITTQCNNNPFSAASPNLNHHQLNSQPVQNPLCITTSRQHRSLENSDMTNSSPNNPNLHLHHRGGTRGQESSAECPGLSLNSPNNKHILSRSQSYQVQEHQQEDQFHPPVHYYASPVVVSQPILPPQTQQRMIGPHPVVHPMSLSFNEPPLLMRAHLHNQNVRLNNFLMKIRQHHHHPIQPDAFAVEQQIPQSDSFQERIYETVGSEDDNDQNDDDDEEDEEHGCVDGGGIIRNRNSMHHHNNAIRDHCFHLTNEGSGNGLEQHRTKKNRRLPTAISNLESGFPFSNRSSGNVDDIASKSKTEQSSKSKRSKTKLHPSYSSQQYYTSESCEKDSMCQQPPRPPVPMALFGPNTFLSETETRLILETDDREESRKFKRLINEAEALLREITAVKSQQQPWVPQQQFPRMQNPMRVEDCPQSDPLRRKGYDCWALRRLQQELAGCCASPPVLHRSRMNLQSPSTPTAATTAIMNSYFSLVPNSQMTNANFTDSHNLNNAHF
ncbi:hypothetical protein Fcan01_08410, partial [Folsomia candida]